MEKFFHKNRLIGIRVRDFKRGTLSITAKNEPLQVLTFSKPAGTTVAPHRHQPGKRVTNALQECLVVITGKVRVDLFGSEKKAVKRVTLHPGDLFIMVSGGHAVTFLTAAEIYEIKNGPFLHDRIELG